MLYTRLCTCSFIRCVCLGICLWQAGTDMKELQMVTSNMFSLRRVCLEIMKTNLLYCSLVLHNSCVARQGMLLLMYEIFSYFIRNIIFFTGPYFNQYSRFWISYVVSKYSACLPTLIMSLTWMLQRNCMCL